MYLFSNKAIVFILLNYTPCDEGNEIIEIIAPHIFNLGTRWSEWSASRHGRFIPRERTHGRLWI